MSQRRRSNQCYGVGSARVGRRALAPDADPPFAFAVSRDRFSPARPASPTDTMRFCLSFTGCDAIRRVVHLLLAVFAVAPSGCQVAQQTAAPLGRQLWSEVSGDYRQLYASSETYKLMGPAFAVGATMAHTDIDEDFRQWYQEDVRSSDTDHVAEVGRVLGDGMYVVPAYLAAYGVGAVFHESAAARGVGEWGNRCFRSFAVGTPALLVTQAATGASRPGETNAESDWVPFHDTNGVSGHAFVGALPFMNAAAMCENPVGKVALYTASAFPAWHRVNHDSHYASQAMLGWMLAYTTVAAVDRTNEEQIRAMVIEPVPTGDGPGIGMTFRY